MLIAEGSLNEILRALDRQIEYLSGASISLIVCGGSALAALGLVNRTTKDVDVLASAEDSPAGPVVHPLLKMPDWLDAAARRVARDFGLPKDWLNLGPARLIELGLPEGFASRLTRKSYGRHLTVFYIGRLDQVYFKLYAAVDRNDYHTQDLQALHPSRDELKQAAHWTLTHDVSVPFRDALKDFLKKNGYEDVAQELP